MNGTNFSENCIVHSKSHEMQVFERQNEDFYE
jgi:hypothetical protein